MNKLYSEFKKLIILGLVITFSFILPLLLHFYHLFDNLKKITYLSSFHSLMSARILDVPFLFINAKFLSFCT